MTLAVDRTAKAEREGVSERAVRARAPGLNGLRSWEEEGGRATRATVRKRLPFQHKEGTKEKNYQLKGSACLERQEGYAREGERWNPTGGRLKAG